MVSFASDIQSQTGEAESTQDWQSYARQLTERAKAAARPQAAIAGMMLPSINPMEQVKLDRQFKSGQFANRQQATQQGFQQAKATDELSGTIGDRVRAALFSRQQAESGLGEQYRQLGKNYDQGIREMWQQSGQKIREQDFTAFQNAADRFDKIQQAYMAGNAEMQMLEAAKNHQLNLADIDRYYKLRLASLENAIRDMQAMTDMDRQKAAREMASDAQNNATWASGLTGILSGLLGNWLASKF